MLLIILLTLWCSPCCRLGVDSISQGLSVKLTFGVPRKLISQYMIMEQMVLVQHLHLPYRSIAIDDVTVVSGERVAVKPNKWSKWYLFIDNCRRWFNKRYTRATDCDDDSQYLLHLHLYLQEHNMKILDLLRIHLEQF